MWHLKVLIFNSGHPKWMHVYSFGILLIEMYTYELPEGEEKQNSVARRWSKLYRLVQTALAFQDLTVPAWAK